MPSPATVKINTRSSQKKAGVPTVVWWVGWILLTILSFFAAASIWTPVIAHHVGSIHHEKASILWVTSVFGTWLVILIPLIIVMYQKVDKAYEDARIRREKAANRFRSTFVEKAKRLLPSELSKKLSHIQETITGGHLVTVVLKDGRRIPHVFISNEREILGIYAASEMTFEGKDIADLEAADRNHLPRFLAPQWLRVDGVLPAE
jgi:hypothetical protein